MNFDKFINSWEIPNIRKDQIYGQKFRWNLFKTDDTIKTEETEVPLSQEFGTIKLLSHKSIVEYRNKYKYVHLGLVQVGVKPLTKEGLSTSIYLVLRDKRHMNFTDSLLGMVESSLCNGPINFEVFPNFSVSLMDKNILDVLTLQVKIQSSKMVGGSIPVALVYRVYYKVASSPGTNALTTSPIGSTPFIQTDLSKACRKVARSTTWSEVSIPDDCTMEEKPQPDPVQNPNRRVISESEDNLGQVHLTIQHT